MYDQLQENVFLKRDKFLQQAQSRLIDQKTVPEFNRASKMPDFVNDSISEIAEEMPQVTVPQGIEASDEDIKAFYMLELQKADWTLEQLARDFAQEFDTNEGYGKKVTRDFLNMLVNAARFNRYSNMDVDLDDKKFKWVGPKDENNHEACIWLSNKTSNGVELWQIEQYIQEAKRKFVDDPPDNPWIVHDWCRHQVKQHY